jgi:hypothetical protein
LPPPPFFLFRVPLERVCLLIQRLLVLFVFVFFLRRVSARPLNEYAF